MDGKRARSILISLAAFALHAAGLVDPFVLVFFLAALACSEALALLRGGEGASVPRSRSVALLAYTTGIGFVAGSAFFHRLFLTQA
jgi:hypothetical protein